MAAKKTVSKKSISKKQSKGKVKQVEKKSRPEKEEGEDIIDMDEAIELLKTTRPTFYRWLKEGKVKGMKAGRQWRFYREDIERFMRGDEPRIEFSGDFKPLIEALAEALENAGLDVNTIKKLKGGDDNPVVGAVNMMIKLALVMNASDMHLECHKDKGLLRLRVDGVLHNLADIDIRIMPALAERYKMMAGCNVQEKYIPQDGRIHLNVEGRKIDLRISFVPVLFGEMVTVRLLSADAVSFTLDQLPFRDQHRKTIIKYLEKPNGLIIFTGPTGSGKTTTLYAAMNYLNKPDVKLISVEEPVEYAFAGISQIAVNPGRGLTFSRAIRSILRSDPDVIVVSEISDMETVSLCCEASLTGHRVLTSLHTNDAPNALARMVDIGVPSFLVGDATSLVVAQRLVRVLCPHCSEECSLPENLLDRAVNIVRSGGMQWEVMPKNWRKAVGCKKCRNLGYLGRTCINEVLEVSGEICTALIKGASCSELKTIAIGKGMTTIQAEAVLLAAQGKTSFDEVLRIASMDDQ